MIQTFPPGDAVIEKMPNRARLVYVYNKTRETFVATEAKIANDCFSRLVGLLGKRKDWARPGRGLWIVPCHGVHTVGMLFAVDLIYLDRNNHVVHIEEHVAPYRISTVILRAHSVLELPAHTVYRTGTRVGDQIEISRVLPENQVRALKAV